MTNKNVRTGDAAELRKRAEEIAREKAAQSRENHEAEALLRAGLKRRGNEG